jgi:hypothetical protein
MLFSILPTCFYVIATAAAEYCTRESLKCVTDAYLSAQSSGRSHLLSSLTSCNLTYTENDNPVDIRRDIRSQALKIDHNISIYDTTACSTFTEIVVTNPAKPYVIVTRMVFKEREVATIESIVTTTGDWLFKYDIHFVLHTI